MPYIDPLDPATPADNSYAGEGDDRIRELKRAAIERFSTFFIDLDADPLVPQNDSVPAAAVVGLPVLETNLSSFFQDTAANPLVPKNNSIPIAAVIGGTTVAEGAVGAPQLQDAAVTAPKLANDAVTQPKMADASVGTAELIDANVTTPKLVDGAVTAPKVNSALADLLTVIKLGTRALSQAETALATGTYKEFDVAVAGAKAGRGAGASWVSTSVGVQYPTPVAPAAGNPGWIAGDGIRLQAWCLYDGSIRVRLSNLTGGALDMGASGATLTAWCYNKLSDEP